MTGQLQLKERGSRGPDEEGKSVRRLGGELIKFMSLFRVEDRRRQMRTCILRWTVRRERRIYTG